MSHTYFDQSKYNGILNDVIVLNDQEFLITQYLHEPDPKNVMHSSLLINSLSLIVVVTLIHNLSLSWVIVVTLIHHLSLSRVIGIALFRGDSQKALNGFSSTPSS